MIWIQRSGLNGYLGPSYTDTGTLLCSNTETPAYKDTQLHILRFIMYQGHRLKPTYNEFEKDGQYYVLAQWFPKSDGPRD